MEEEWVQVLLGQGGALALLLFVCVYGFRFFTRLLDRQDIKADKQAEKYEKLSTMTLVHIHAHTVAVQKLSEKIEHCVRR